MKCLKVVGFIGFFLLAAMYPVHAQQAAMKFAYVDLARLFDEYGKTKDYDKVLEAENKKYQDERDKKIGQIKEMQGKLAMLKDAEKAKMEADMEKLKNEILEFDRAKRTDLVKSRDEKLREIALDIEKTVSEYAKKEDLTFVFDKRTLVFTADTLNITETILKSVNDNYSKQPKK
jgi:Skp family chaperone for outer membrane proteins